MFGLFSIVWSAYSVTQLNAPFCGAGSQFLPEGMSEWTPLEDSHMFDVHG
jgi:hypothetical protein